MDDNHQYKAGFEESMGYVRVKKFDTKQCQYYLDHHRAHLMNAPGPTYKQFLKGRIAGYEYALMILVLNNGKI